MSKSVVSGGMIVDSDSYKKKVFDEDVFNFCIHVLDFIDKQPHRNQFLRRAILDALTACSSLRELSQYVEGLKYLPFESFDEHKQDVLDVLNLLGNDSQCLKNFLASCQLLAERSGFKNWTDFFNSIKVLEKSIHLQEDFLITVRHLAQNQEFKSWIEFFKSTKVVAGAEILQQDFQMTVRHLAAVPHFQEWQTFFTGIKILESKFSETSNYLLSVRHAIKYFKKPESLQGILRAMAIHPDFAGAFAYGQLDSKQWLVEEGCKTFGSDWGTVFVLAGWVGVLPRFLFDADLTVKNIRSFDLDLESGPVSEIINQCEVQKNWQYKSSTLDITKMKYPTRYNVQRKDGSLCELQDTPDVVINTSCEHISDVSSWWAQIPKGTKVVLQNNDGFHIPEHVSCCKTLEEFKNRMKMSKVLYEGEKPLPEFNRFMLIGIK